MGGVDLEDSLRDSVISLIEELADGVDGGFGVKVWLLSDVGEHEPSSACLELELDQGRQPTSFPRPPAEDARGGSSAVAA